MEHFKGSFNNKGIINIFENPKAYKRAGKYKKYWVVITNYKLFPVTVIYLFISDDFSLYKTYPPAWIASYK